MQFDRIRNMVIRGEVEVTSIENKMRDVILRLFDHIRRSMDSLVRSCERIVLLEGERG